MRNIRYADVKVDRIYTSSWDGTTYYVIHDAKAYGGRGFDHMFNCKEYTEYEACREFYDRMVEEDIRECVRKVARELNDSERHEMADDLVFMFLDQEAWGDRSFYLNTKDHKYYSTWFSIGD